MLRKFQRIKKTSAPTRSDELRRSLAHRVNLAVELEGPEGMLWHDAEGDGFWQYQCLNQFASRIGGGTEEVHRNNLGEQALGLPREPALDRDVPWTQTKRS